MGYRKIIGNKIKDYLKDQNCYFVKYFANRMTKAGIPDILASVNGYFVGIEVKASNGRPSELQKWNIEQIHASGGFGVILYPEHWEEFKNMIVFLKGGDPDFARHMEQRINDKFF